MINLQDQSVTGQDGTDRNKANSPVNLEISGTFKLGCTNISNSYILAETHSPLHGGEFIE